MLTPIVEPDLDPKIRSMWRESRVALDLTGNDIIRLTCDEGQTVAEFVEFLDPWYPGIYEDWARGCVNATWTYIDSYVSNVVGGHSMLKSTLGFFNTCEPEAARRLVWRRFIKAKTISDTSPAFIRHALDAHIYLGCGVYDEAVKETQFAFCSKQMLGFDRDFRQQKRAALLLYASTDQATADVLAKKLHKYQGE